MAWWDYGIQGKPGEGNIISSGGLSYPGGPHVVPSLDGYQSVGSIPLTGNPVEGQIYSKLILTTATGTQVFIDYRARLQTGVTVYLPEETVNIWVFGFRTRLHKSGTDLIIGSGFTEQYGATIIAGEDDIYNFNYRGNNGVFSNPLGAFNKDKGGNLVQVGALSTSDGITFYDVGFTWIHPNNDYTVKNPALAMCSIPSSALNNKYWFDPEKDALPPAAYYEGVNSGGSSGRPVDYDYAGDDVDFPDLPSGASAIGIGRMKLYHPTAAQLNTILDVIWTDPTPDPSWDVLDKLVENFTKWLYKPEKWLVSLMLMPINISGTNQKVYLGKYDTMTTSPAISNQWQIVDCGSLSIPLKSDSAFDFSPYVKAMIYLPYVGFRPINANEIMGGTIYIKYYIDMFTGSGLCLIKIANENSNTSVLYSYECNIAQQVPITSDNYNQVINSLISASLSLASHNMGAAAAQGADTISGLFSPDVQTSGKENPNTGALGSEVPYVVLHFPVQAMPSGFENQNGYPSSLNIMLGNLSGYTEVEKIHLDIPGATDEELKMIDDALKQGVIL